MRRARAISLLSLVTLLVAAAVADARTPRPVVRSVSPLSASVGEVMTIQGRNFIPGYGQNMVVLVSSDGRVRYVRSENSTIDSLTIRIPQKIERLLPLVNEQRQPARFSVKVISKRMGRVATNPLAKPTIGPDVGGDCDKDGTPNPTDTDDDADFLPDTIEKTARTNPCVADSDGDKLLDGWEFMSALDLNRSALPYPGKKPYPNALFADAVFDFDGDGLHAWAEHTMWWAGGHKYPLDYSDGDQTTAPEPVGNQVWNDIQYPRGELSDDERDFDRDGLANIYEYRAPDFEPWSPNFPSVERPNFLDPDSDGDGELDGSDDQDHDDVSNIDELIRGTWAMNPCDPYNGDSRTCPRWMSKEEEPRKPQVTCVSRTVMPSEQAIWATDSNPGFVKWIDQADLNVQEVGYCPHY